MRWPHRAQDPVTVQQTELPAQRSSQETEWDGGRETASLLSLTPCSFLFCLSGLMTFGRIWKGIAPIRLSCEFLPLTAPH